MNILEQKMYTILKDLKDNHHLEGIKISFEDEGLTENQAQIISSIAFKCGVPVTLKIGGCEAKCDIRAAKNLGVQKVVAPMIETAYALEKFVKSVIDIYDFDELNDTKFAVNIETIQGYNNLDEMLTSPASNRIETIVMGRSDFVGSLKMNKSEVNSDKILSYAIEIAKKCKQHNKHLFVGGNLNANSISFFNQLNNVLLNGVETRNIIFNKEILNDPDAFNAIEKALEFELLWLEDKKRYGENLIKEDIARIDNLKERFIVGGKVAQ